MPNYYIFGSKTNIRELVATFHVNLSVMRLGELLGGQQCACQRDWHWHLELSVTGHPTIVCYSKLLAKVSAIVA